jgi:5-methylcytosine-specific restriction endonuclease McrA
MQTHTRNYLRHFDLGEQDICRCEACGKEGRVDGEGFDIHHIYGRTGENADEVKNLILLCRKCHDKAHSVKLTKSELQFIHNNVLMGNRKTFIK